MNTAVDGDATTSDAPGGDTWLGRCAARIAAVDSGIEADEAEKIAATMASVERLRAMPPEAAVDFVSGQAGRDEPERYERRRMPRSADSIFDAAQRGGSA